MMGNWPGGTAELGGDAGVKLEIQECLTVFSHGSSNRTRCEREDPSDSSEPAPPTSVVQTFMLLCLQPGSTSGQQPGTSHISHAMSAHFWSHPVFQTASRSQDEF